MGLKVVVDIAQLLQPDLFEADEPLEVRLLSQGAVDAVDGGLGSVSHLLPSDKKDSENFSHAQAAELGRLEGGSASGVDGGATLHVDPLGLDQLVGESGLLEALQQGKLHHVKQLDVLQPDVASNVPR